MKTLIKHKLLFLAILFYVVVIASCKSLIPENIDALGDDVNYSLTEFKPTLGRRTNFENIVNTGNKSTLPLTFKMINIRTWEGMPATELTDKFPVKIWKKSYTGEEKSIAEIEAKREVQYRPIFELATNSGNLIMWDYGTSDWIRTLPDSCYVFDIEVSNSGGLRYVRNLKLKPYKQMPYEPTPYNRVTGLATETKLSPTVVNNIFGEKTDEIIFDNNVEVYLFKDITNITPGGSLSIAVVDSLNQPIDIQKFKDTKWETMIHGFNPQFRNNKVIYDVAFPIPLIQRRTRYTNNSGNRAKIELLYNRIGFGGLVVEALLGFEFAIYEEGHWEIQFRFRTKSPKFDNE